MKQAKYNAIWRAAALLLAVCVATGSVSIAQAKYVSDAAVYHSDGFYTYCGKVENSTPGGPYAVYLKAGWWAFSMRGGQGGKNNRRNNDRYRDTGNGGSSGIAKAMYYLAADTWVYYYVAEGGGYGGGTEGSHPFTSGNNPRKASVYGGGPRGQGPTDQIIRQPSNGGGASLIYYGNSNPTAGGVTIIAVAGGGGGAGFDWGKADDNPIPREETGGAAGNAVATTTGTPAQVTQNLNAWGGVHGGISSGTSPADAFNFRLTANHSTAQVWVENGKGGSLTAGGARGQDHLNANGDGGFLRGGEGRTGRGSNDNGAGGGGGGYYGGGAGGERSARRDNHGAGGGGSSYLHPDCYEVPTTGAYGHANRYFTDNNYDLKSYENTNNAAAPGVCPGDTVGCTDQKPPRHDGAVCMIYLGVERYLRGDAAGY